jgi:chlorite dismutase
MGFVPEETVYNLSFEGSPTVDGLEVKMSALSVGEYSAMIRLMNVSDLSGAAEANDEITRMFASSLRSWNVMTKAGEKVPTTLTGVEEQEQPFIMIIFRAWQKAMAEIEEDLEKGSASGVTSLEASLGMGGQSVSLPSGLKPN